MADLLLRLIFPAGFLVFSVRLILDLMGVELHFTRTERVVLSMLFATMCVGFALVGNSHLDHATWHTLTKLLFALVIFIMGRRTAYMLIKLHTPVH